VADETLRNLALSNALSSLVRERRLPQKVFAGQWEDYLFFESDFMFEEDFMNVANVLYWPWSRMSLRSCGLLADPIRIAAGWHLGANWWIGEIRRD
jgi:hypothetical protein